MKTQNTIKQQLDKTCQPFIFDGSAAALAEAETLRRMSYVAARFSAGHGRFTKMTSEVAVYEDNRHIVTEARLSGGGHGTLVKERQSNGTYSNQMMTIANAHGDVSVIEFGRN